MPLQMTMRWLQLSTAAHHPCSPTVTAPSKPGEGGWHCRHACDAAPAGLLPRRLHQSNSTMEAVQACGSVDSWCELCMAWLPGAHPPIFLSCRRLRWIGGGRLFPQRLSQGHGLPTWQW